MQAEDDLSPLFERAAAGETFIDGYRVCGPGCPAPATDGSCANHSDCTNRACECHLFSRDNADPPQDPDSWKHEADPGVPHSGIAGRTYRCFCVEPPATATEQRRA